MGHQPSVLDMMREAIAGSVYSKGMTDHLVALPEPALRHYLDEWLPAAVAAGGFAPGELATDLLEMTTEVMREQLRFNRRGAPEPSFPPERYEDRQLMERFYLNGLTAAFVFWPNHWALLRYFEDRFAALPLPATGRCLDVGCGPGVLSARFGRAHPGWQVTSADISSFAVARTGRLWGELGLDRDRQHLSHASVDQLLADHDSQYDAIVFSELVEHLDDGPDVLRRLAERLMPGGAMFFTTALNSYFPDHRIYLHELEEVDAMVEAAGLVTLDREVDFVADTPHGPQSDIYAVLVRPGSALTGHRAPGDGLHHIGMLVRDLERSLGRWLARGAERVLGPVTDLRMDCRVAFVRVPETAPLVELVTPYSRASALWNRLGRNPLDHVCYQVAGLDRALAEREQAGARLVFGPVEAAALRRRVAFVLDGDGLLTELVEHDRERPWLV
jgi:2-polyprenyl-3-methyl-5-hydroxy-6-metoxy-1,4-benzoquinol methylase/catechol 2,3-dioxygenase-like lactoylglutathione lyase family enzyme